MTNRLLFSALLVAAIVLVGPSVSFGQEIDPGAPTQLPDTPPNNIPDSNVNTSGEAPDIQVGEQVDIELSEDTRNQGFVGATTATVTEQGYVGPSAIIGSPLAEGASYGGGVNSGGGGGGRGGGGGGQAGFGAAENGFPVTRRNLRTRLRPSFLAPQIPSEQIANRFGNRFYRLPQSQDFSGRFQVSVNNRTATITGSVPSQANADKLVRQLRLEPGVYKINNQLRIGN